MRYNTCGDRPWGACQRCGRVVPAARIRVCPTSGRYVCDRRGCYDRVISYPTQDDNVQTLAHPAPYNGGARN